jgi:PAS domain S-box-containing protein
LATVPQRPLRQLSIAARAKRLFETLATSAADGHIAINLKGSILTWNAASEHLFGYAESEIIGRHISMLCLPDHPAEDYSSVYKLKHQAPVKAFDAVRIRKDGKPVNVSITLLPVNDGRGKLRGVSAVYREITNRGLSDKPRVDREAIKAAIRANSEPSFAAALPASKRLSVLLATAAAGGTIAAVRELGEHGVDVGVMTHLRLAPAAWSRCAARRYSAPLENDNEKFLERLLAIGAAKPGQVLLPTSDETAWLYTVNADRLKEHFFLYQPSVETMRRIMDKKLFADAAAKAGIPVLPSWEPRSLEEVIALAPGLPYPVLIKPRTHVNRVRNDKGMVVHSKTELIERYQQFIGRESHTSENPHLTEASLPILQQFVSVSNEGVYSVTGFIDRTGELFVTRHSTKVFQRSKPVGVGVCFESLPDNPALSEAVRRLCLELGHFGIFEVEFLRFDGGWAAIDFNARLFNQVGMDSRRGMPLALLACLDAAGRSRSLRTAVAKAQAEDADSDAVFCDTFTLRAILLAGALTGRISRDEREHWRTWRKRNADRTVDFAADRDDPKPGLIHALSEIYLGIRAFPRFLSSMPRLAPAMAPSVLPSSAMKVRS